eukprot:m.162980 g.162980  ORF g.162980 m.162980 type:complete len:59 (-) comp9873_c0_seq8:103-279(-)
MLFYNEITTLPTGVFSDLANLQMLLLNNNAITTLPAGNLTTLLSLDPHREPARDPVRV